MKHLAINRLQIPLYLDRFQSLAKVKAGILPDHLFLEIKGGHS